MACSRDPDSRGEHSSDKARVRRLAAGSREVAFGGMVGRGRGSGGRDGREFGAFTADLYTLAEWLRRCGIETIAMESTGVYWIPLFDLLAERGFEVRLVDPRQLKNVPGRKSDVLDCQWIQQLHTFGLLSAAFRPDDQICALRSYLRQRAMLVTYASHHIQHVQKALEQMNVKLTRVVSDVTGVTGMRIIRAILDGQRDPRALAGLRDRRCQHDEATIARSLEGSWRPEHLFALRQAVELLDFYQQQLAACDREIEAYLGRFFRRLKARLGTPKAITASAHKLARLIYRMLRFGTEYVDQGQDYYEQRYRARVVSTLTRRAAALGYTLVKTEGLSSAPSEI